MTKQEILKTYYGYDCFRPGQEAVVDALLDGQDVLDIMPTGGGKSLCYQIPALLLPGITLVISPLVSLMRDQVTALVQMGVPAAFLNSSLSYRQYCLALDRAKDGWYKLIYVAPERLETPGFLRFAQSADISLLAVDEAHCISQWGQDFRPAYLNIPAFVQSLPKRPVVGAFTATATPHVQDDIQKLLSLRDPLRLVSGFDRNNLYFEVRQPEKKRAELLKIIHEHRHDCGIIYCSTRKNVEEICSFLQDEGLSATRYHAGLPQPERAQNQEDFLYDRVNIMVATNAFGMGIDKPDVRYVIHYNMPKDVESYYQEAGRAGRDGDPAACILLYSGQDVRTAQFLIEQNEPPEDVDPETAARLRERDLERLKQMTFYSKTRDCLRQFILKYFGERAPNYCGNCSNCLHGFEDVEIGSDARQILSCVEESGQRFGMTLIALVLNGSDDERIHRYRFERLPTYGTLSQFTKRELLDRIHFLIDSGYLELSEGDYPVLKLTARGRTLMHGSAQLTMKAPKKEKRKAASVDPTLSPEQLELLDRLKRVRAYFAKRRGVPAFVIFSDKTLREMAALMPRSRQELLTISGIGVKKDAQYGEAFLSVIADFIKEKAK